MHFIAPICFLLALCCLVAAVGKLDNLFDSREDRNGL